MLISSLLFLVGAPMILAKCKCPSASTWKTLNATVDGKLLRNEPIAKPYYHGEGYSQHKCQQISSNWTTNSWLAGFPTGYSYPTIERCPAINATLGVYHYPQCDLGNYPCTPPSEQPRQRTSPPASNLPGIIMCDW
ncbi:hypothetical protein NUU61_003835 [Penicillium alfredii]|uniref:Secreted protein n=1 Tax=Penicillium alfredii TaxID=1506179 RepID=A0A9W9FK57_9EURO|nr:uncharacterized protein NUU61_003835 [Penicillium alfredii]KAJ5101613.1 hypothetical protein NUU61_003835 [Penicillium alfredii]